MRHNSKKKCSLLVELRFPAKWPDPAAWVRAGLKQVLPNAVYLGHVYQAEEHVQTLKPPKGQP